jgi:hypothetical protein
MIYITASDEHKDDWRSNHTMSLPNRRAIRIVGTEEELLKLEQAIRSARTMPDGWHADFETGDFGTQTTIEIRKLAPPAFLGAIKMSPTCGGAH